MAEVIWTEAALGDLDTIADYLALDSMEAARKLVDDVMIQTEQLATHPETGSPARLLRGKRYRQIVVPPCRLSYRYDGDRVFILNIARS